MEQFILTKKAQVWSLDLIIASVIFSIGIIILYIYAINYSPETKNQLNELLYEGNLASKLILSDPENNNAHYEMLFDLILSLKPYIFNMQTVNTHQERISEVME